MGMGCWIPGKKREKERREKVGPKSQSPSLKPVTAAMWSKWCHGPEKELGRKLKRKEERVVLDGARKSEGRMMAGPEGDGE